MILDDYISFSMKFRLNDIITIQCIISFLSFEYKVTRKILILTIGILSTFYLIHDKHIFLWKENVSKRLATGEMRNNFNMSPNVHIIDLTAKIQTKFQCIKTKALLNNLSTIICLHQTKKDKYVSGAFQNSTSIWEEDQVTRMLEFLIRHPHLHFIDIGANIGTYTMFAAALGRFVLAIDCFAPNLVRLTRAVQLTNISDRVVLVQNALFTYSGQMLRLSVDTTNIGGQGIVLSGNYSAKYRATNNISTKNPYIVKTITFDEVLPILVAYGIRGALMKIDIEGSESFVVESGNRVFDTLDIPFVQMEWKMVRRYVDRVKIILDFFTRRNYVSMTSSCRLLNPHEHIRWPDEIYWLKRNTSNFC